MSEKKLDYLYKIDNLYARVTNDSERFWIEINNENTYISKEEFIVKRDELLNSPKSFSMALLDCSMISKMEFQ